MATLLKTQAAAVLDPRPISFAASRASVALDAMRAAAALVVVIDHLRHGLFVQYHDIAAARMWFFVPYLVTSCGHEAVIIFFVLSGFLIAGSIVRSLEKRSWSWRGYLTHRLVRLWIVLLPALALGWLFDRFTLWQGQLHPATADNFYQLWQAPGLTERLSLFTFLGNLFFLQTLRLPTLHGLVTVAMLGTNGALWSLADEFWYYLLFPLGLCVITGRLRGTARACAGLGWILLAFFVGVNVLALFPVWLAGAALLLLPPLRMAGTPRLIATALYVAIFFFAGAMQHLHPIASDSLLSGCTMIFLWILLSASRIPAEPGAARSVSIGMARFSYTLYLIHEPLLALLTRPLNPGSPWQPTPGHLLLAGAVLGIILLFAWGLAAVTEFHTAAVRGWVEGWLGRGETGAPDRHPLTRLA